MRFIPEELKKLNHEQQNQVLMQLESHEHERYVIDIVLSDKEILKDFIVCPEVLRPESMTSLFLSQYLNEEKSLFLNKSVVDIGCGSGIQGVVMGIGGARRVVFSDVFSDAVKNTKENVEKFQLSHKSEVVESDLFENVSGNFDVIVFNHPFFSADPIKERPVSISMLNSGELIGRFFEEAKMHLNKDGVIIMPYFQLAGETNDPKIQGPKHGFEASAVFHREVDTGLQKGEIFVYSLRPKS